LSLLLFSAAGFAQVRAGLRGRILDASGAVVANAKLQLIETAKDIHRSTTSSSAGDYVFEDLNPGDYQLEAIATGFQRVTVKNVTLAVGQTASIDLVMKVGGLKEEVTVQATGSAFQSQTSNIQTNIPTKAIVAMPLNSRNFVQLTTLAPGVEIPPGTVLPRINGGRPRTNEYLYDGISALQPEPGQVVFFPIIDE